MTDGNRDRGRNGDEYEDGGGSGNFKEDVNGEETGGEREPGNLISYSRGGAKDARV